MYVKSINVLHEEFFETTYKQVNSVYHRDRQMWDAKLIGADAATAGFAAANAPADTGLVGLSNSRKMLFKEGWN